MKNELRIGNLVKDIHSENGAFKIIELKRHKCEYGAGYVELYENLRPIELTEEWFLKLGFEKVNHIHGYSFWNFKRKRKSNEPSICIYDTYTTIGNNSIVKHCKFVHQLQNLYFALTQIELTIK
jgi:hypothetical protein